MSFVDELVLCFLSFILNVAVCYLVFKAFFNHMQGTRRTRRTRVRAPAPMPEISGVHHGRGDNTWTLSSYLCQPPEFLFEVYSLLYQLYDIRRKQSDNKFSSMILASVALSNWIHLVYSSVDHCLPLIANKRLNGKFTLQACTGRAQCKCVLMQLNATL